MLNPKPATYADLEKVSPHKVAELINGALVTHPRPAPRHALASSAFGAELSQPFQRKWGGSGGWMFADEPELHFGCNVLVPDLAGWRRERLSVMPETAYFEVAPDWVGEVLSVSTFPPATASDDRGAKARIYAAAGVAHLWLLDPDQQVIEAFSLVNGSWVLSGSAIGAENVRIPPFDLISFPLSVLFPLDASKGDEPNVEG